MRDCSAACIEALQLGMLLWCWYEVYIDMHAKTCLRQDLERHVWQAACWLGCVENLVTSSKPYCTPTDVEVCRLNFCRIAGHVVHLFLKHLELVFQVSVETGLRSSRSLLSLSSLLQCVVCDSSIPLRPWSEECLLPVHRHHCQSCKAPYLHTSSNMPINPSFGSR